VNLLAEISDAIQEIVPYHDIKIYTYSGQTNAKGVVTATYADPLVTTAGVQLENVQNLKHIDNINLTLVYKRFYVLSSVLTGLNRNLATGGDFIVMDGFKYKIVMVKENFSTGWVCIVGAEDGDYTDE
jgi:hypothetical protein